MFAPHSKKIHQQRAAFILQHTAFQRGLVIELVIVKQIDDAARRTGLRIVRAKYDFFQARMQHRASAHGTGFKSDVELAPRQAVVAEFFGGTTQGDHLGMRRRVVRRDRPIAAGGDHHAVFHHYRADRNFAQSGSFARFLGCEAHESLFCG